MSYFDLLKSPGWQLVGYLCVMSTIFLYRWRDTSLIMQAGLWGFFFWIPLGGMMGIPSSAPWSYYLYFIAAVIGGYISYILFVLISDTWGDPYNGEGFLAMLIPINMLLIIPPLLVIKLIVRVFS